MGGKCDGKSAVEFNDPLNELPPLVGCGGVLAAGGFCIKGTATFSIGGRPYRKIREGDLVVTAGLGSCIGRRGFAEILTHELGHSIGIGHSSQNPSEPNPVLRDATMYFLAHSTDAARRSGRTTSRR